ncbi:MAG: PilZ domain-containing protein, partial [Pseudobdellovibrio sp.]
SEWIRADRWTPNEYLQNEILKKQSAVSEAEPSGSHRDVGLSKSYVPLSSVPSNSAEKYKVHHNGDDYGEMTKEELSLFTARLEDISKVYIQDNTTQEWKDIFSYPDLINKLGITRRKSQRVPILAQFSGVNEHEQKIQARVITISEGGLGLTDSFDLKLGETLRGQITSPHFYTPLTLSAEVTYAGLDGYVGLKYTELNDEGMAIVTDYINRFRKDSDEP